MLNLRSTLYFLKPYLQKSYLKIVLFYIGRLAMTVNYVVTPIILGIMINQIVYYQNFNLFLKISLIFLGVSVFTGGLYYFIYEIYADFWNEILYRIRCKLYALVMRLDAKEMCSSNYGDLTQLIQWKSMECVQFIVKNIIHNINNYLFIIFALFIVVRINLWVGLVLLVMVPISVYISWRFGRTIHKNQSKNQEAYGEYIGWLYEILDSLGEIRLLSAQERVYHLFLKHQQKLITTDVAVGMSNLKATNIISNINTWIQMLLFSVLAILSVKTKLSIGSIIVILSYYSSLVISLKSVSENYMMAQNRIATIQRVKALMDKPTEDSRNEKPELHIEQGYIDFHQLSFAYNENNPIIKNMNLHIAKGERVAIVGESGCGKSTLAYLLLGFFAPQKGEILFDGKSANDFSLKSIRNQIGVVQQVVYLFDGTIRDNIMLGNQDATEEELIEACKAAGAYDFIMDMQQGFDTVVGRNGRQLSGGQKQRIAIARIYIKKPAILVFDEATASLDNETEALIHEAWREMLKGRTAIIIAHRLSSVMLCDTVALMKDGCICEQRTPQEMVSQSKEFRSLFAIKE